MPNEQITIIVHATWIEVRIGKCKPENSRTSPRRGWQAPGLDIWLWGAVPLAKWDKVAYHAMAACLDRKIPLIQLHRWENDK